MRRSFLLLVLLAEGCQPRPAQKTAATPPPARAVADAPLRETRWVLRQLAGQPITVPADTREPYLTLRAEGNGSCNRFRGSFFSGSPRELKFTPLMSTRMACPALETENAFTRALGQSSTYRISGDTLRVLDTTGAAVARLEAVHLK